MTGRLIEPTHAAMVQALEEAAKLPGSGVHSHPSIDGGRWLLAETLAGLAQDLCDRLSVFRPTHRHYKGGEYRVVSNEVRAEGDVRVPLVLYQGVTGGLWTRPYDDFHGRVEVPAPPQQRLRFRPLSDEQLSKEEVPSVSHGVDGAREGGSTIAERAAPEPLVSVQLTRDEVERLAASPLGAQMRHATREKFCAARRRLGGAA